MKSINLAMPFVLATSLLAGCVAEVGDEPAGVPDEDGPISEPLDGRAAMASELALGIKSGPQNLTSWYTGSIAPGATGHWYWNNAPLTVAYQVDINPIGASTTNPCKLQVTKTWDQQNNGGEREFHFYVKNIGAIACGGDVLLDATTRVSTWSTGGINPGASKGWTWNNASPADASFFAGVSPTGATSTAPCELQVVGPYYAEQPSGEREFRFTVTNIGSIACQGDIQLAETSSTPATWGTGAMNPGTSKSWTWNNAPTGQLHVPGLAPGGASGLTACLLQVTSAYDQQVINADGSAEREFHFTVQNVGSLACYGTVLLNIVN